MPQPPSQNPPSPTLTVHSYDNLEEVREPWEGLLQNCNPANGYQTWEWVETWWKHFGGDLASRGVPAKLHIVMLKDDAGLVVGAYPFYYVIPGNIGRRALLPFGDYGPLEGMGEESPCLALAGREQEVHAAILRHLMDARRHPWDISFYHWHADPAEPVEPGRLLGFLGQMEGRQVVQLPESWESYHAQLSKSMRGNLRYYRHRLEKQGHSYSIRSVTEPGKIEKVVDDLIRLHDLRAKSRRGNRHENHMPEAYHRAFVHECFLRLAHTGQALMYAMDIDGETVAVQAAFVCKGELTLFYSGFDPAWHDYSPHTILLAEMIKEAGVRGIRRVNFLSEPKHFRRRWGAVTETIRHNARIIKPSALSIFRVGLAKVRRSIRYGAFGQRLRSKTLPFVTR